MRFIWAEQLGWSTHGWTFPRVSFQCTTISTLFRCIHECVSMSRYSAEGLSDHHRSILFVSIHGYRAKPRWSAIEVELIPLSENIQRRYRLHPWVRMSALDKWAEERNQSL